MERSLLLASARGLFVIIAIMTLIVAIYLIFPLIYPFLFGLLLALVMNPVVNWLEKKARFPRWLAVLSTILLLLAVLAALITLVVVEIVSELNRLQEHLPYLFEDYMAQVEFFILNQLFPVYDRIISLYGTLDEEVQRNIEHQVENFSSQMASALTEAGRGLINGILSFLRSIPMIATAFIISLLAFFFLSKDWPKWQAFFTRIVPERVQISSRSVIQDLKSALVGFVRAQLTLMSITFLIVLIGFWILRVEYALTIALFIGLVDLIPYLGPGLIFVPWIIYLFISGNYFLVIGLSVLYGIVIIQRQMIEPKILGDNVGLDPLVTLFSLFVGFKLFGMIGLIIGPVSMVILGALHRAGIFRDLWHYVKGTA
ncbi:sporulation integral membrane protein YtvI [Caldalkalibacillus uzonensis]|uniref:Sporulation integral membrane protein YtvI n=1 Tax=Caldalkalibacillus uzonensis TaxID=353224 RepID=A0ABU0CPN6_9BACI|nr:sporulation integral membrane protein YtvI [Caldalkalibacillus uzonensis]MDQ0337849.1 sporulation integral membrane protein YtvI [Caldalkalibacillus uzonensis]